MTTMIPTRAITKRYSAMVSKAASLGADPVLIEANENKQEKPRSNETTEVTL
jgi:hypothetical protein